MANFDRREVKVQGDRRPFSLAPMSRPAILRHKDIAAVLEAVQLKPDDELTLAAAVRRIMSEYLGEVILAEQLASHAASLRLLDSISRGSVKLAEQLSQLDQRYLIAIEDARTEPKDQHEPPRFDILSLTHILTRLSHAAARVRQTTRANAKGAPVKKGLDRAMSQLLTAIERRGLEVSVTESGSREPRRRVGGLGGELLLALFRHFYSLVDEPQIWGSVARVRAAEA